MWVTLFLVFSLCLLARLVSGKDPILNSYNISDVTVSGLSSGAYMAVQVHVAYSSIISGAAIFAGGPFYCAQGSVTTAQGVCMDQYMGTPNAQTYINFTNKAFTSKEIDDPANLVDDSVFLFSGNSDSVVKPVVMQTLEKYYQAFVKTGSISSEFGLKAEHCLPTLNYGEQCAVKSSPYIGKCNYDGAGIALQALFGGSLVTGTAIDAHLTTFDQTPFIAKKSSLGNTGYIYVPGACADGRVKCRLHISFHGCVQDLSSIGNQYAVDTGFNSWAEANNIIVLYPYAISSVMPSNPNSCWDWWGYTGSNYVYQSGVQMKFVKDLIDHIRGGASPSVPTSSPISLPPSPTPPPVPTLEPSYPFPTSDPTLKPTSGFSCTEWTACVWDHYNAGRAVFSSNYQHYLCKGSLQDLGLTGYCGGAVGVTGPVTVKLTAADFYEIGACNTETTPTL